MGRYTSLIRDAIAKFAGDRRLEDSITVSDLIRNYNPAMVPQAIGQVLKYQTTEVNKLLKDDGVKVTSYSWNARRKRHMIQISRLDTPARLQKAVSSGCTP